MSVTYVVRDTATQGVDYLVYGHAFADAMATIADLTRLTAEHKFARLDAFELVAVPRHVSVDDHVNADTFADAVPVRVALTRDVLDYPISPVPKGTTGVIVLDPDGLGMRFDEHFPDLEEWDNVAHLRFYGEVIGEDPATFIRPLDAEEALHSEMLAFMGRFPNLPMYSFDDWLSEHMDAIGPDEWQAGHRLIDRFEAFLTDREWNARNA